jgi:hypothetical protein
MIWNATVLLVKLHTLSSGKMRASPGVVQTVNRKAPQKDIGRRRRILLRKPVVPDPIIVTQPAVDNFARIQNSL